MTESPAKKQCVATEEKKSTHEQEKESIRERLNATYSLIKITTEPPVYLSTSLIYESPVLTNIAHLNISDGSFETNEFGDKCFVCLPSDEIPRDTWVVFGLLIDNDEITESININDTTLDDLFYICFKHDIRFDLISETEHSTTTKWTKLQSVIEFIYARSCKQRFPRTQPISEINSYYSVLGKVYAGAIYNCGDRGEKLSRLQYYEMIPSIYHAITSSIAIRAVKGSKV